MSDLGNWAIQSPADDFWMTIIVFVVVAIAGFFGAFYFFQRKRVMEDTPTSKIRSAAQGYVELAGHGKMMEGPPIIAPLTQKPCTYYSYRIEKKRRSKNNTNWSTIDRGRSEELFFIIDETGECIIDPEGASVTTLEKDVWYGNTERPSRGAASGGGLLASGSYRYTEKRLVPNEPLYAIGMFNTVGGAGDVYDPSSDVRELLAHWKKDSESLLQRFDKNKDGQIDMEEWQAVREEALKHVMAQHGDNRNIPPVNMLGQTRDRRRPFLLSAVPQHSLVRRYHYFSVGLISLFFISGVFVTWALNARFAGA